jgi:pyrophosphatase PpaX
LYYKKYAERHEQLVIHNKEIDDLIKYLKNIGIKLGIVTGKAKRSLDISLKSLQMDNLFDVIITGDDVDNSKPHPEGLLKALSLLGVGNSDAIFIGDSDADIHAGFQANVFTIGVHWLPDYQSLDFAMEPNAVFKHVIEFIDFLKAGMPNES